MKKLLAILVLGLLWSGNAFALDFKLNCNFVTPTNQGKEFILDVFIDAKGEDALVVIDTNFTYRKHTTWNKKVAVGKDEIIIGFQYGGGPYLKINRYSLSAFLMDHQSNPHNGKCKKAKRKI